MTILKFSDMLRPRGIKADVKSRLYCVVLLLHILSEAVHAQPPSAQLPTCLEITPLSVTDEAVKKFAIHNACGKTITEVVYERSYKAKEGKVVTGVIAQEFLGSSEWSPADYNADGFSAIAQPWTRFVITFPLAQEEAKAGVKASSLDVSILALGYSNGEVEGNDEDVKQIVSLRNRRLANTNEALRVLQDLMVPGTLEKMCAADLASRKSELKRMGAVSIELFAQEVRNACQNQAWNGKGQDYLRGAFRSAELLLSLIHKQMGGK